MTILEKIKKCVSLVWDFQEIYGEEDIEDFCHNELSTYPQHDEIMEYFKQIENLEMTVGTLRAFSNEQAISIEKLEQENSELKQQIEKMKCCGNCTKGNCVNIGQKGKACAYWTSNKIKER